MRAKEFLNEDVPAARTDTEREVAQAIYMEGNKKMFGKTYLNCVKNTNEDSLNEFATGDSGGDDDEYDLLVKLVKMWWLGNEQQHFKAEKTLASMGISIDEDEPNIILRRGNQFLTFPMDDFQQGVAEGLTEVVDLDTAFPLKWDQQFAAQGEIHAAATDADGREIGISFTPAGNGEVTDVAFTRGGTHEMTGRGDAGRVMATVIKAINLYANKYKPPYLAFSAKSGGGRSGAYTAMIRRHAQGYELLPTYKYPAALNNYLEFIGSDQPFVLART